jgi:hypothetical protein
MNFLKYPITIVIVLLLVFSCTSNDKMEKRIVALERRVAALEVGSPAANKSPDRPVQLANNPAAVEDNSPKSEIVFENMEFDFGTISEGDVIEHTFTFTNTGATPLLIKNATATCGCTVPKWPDDPIPAGGKGEIQVRFDSKNKPNQQIKTITITANTEPEITRLRIKGFVTPQQQTTGPVKQ